MTDGVNRAEAAWSAAVLAATLFAVDPAGTGGVSVAARPGPARDSWLATLRGLLPPEAPVRRVPLHVSDDRLLGGLDLAATLQAGRPVAQRGLLAEADGGVVVVAMAERLPGATAARVAAVLDAGEVAAERDGLTLRAPARLGVVALDEGCDGDERPPAALLDRLAFRVDLDGLRSMGPGGAGAGEVAAARALLPEIRVGEAIIEALCAAAMALGVPSLRAPLLAVRAARAAAALAGRREVSADDAALAGRLVLAPRATTLPAPEETGEPEPGEEASAGADSAERSEPDGSPDGSDDTAGQGDQPVGDVVLEASQAAIPAGLLSQLRSGNAIRLRAQSAGRSGAAQAGVRHGRPAGARRGEPRAGARLNLVATLRAAAPWQRLRKRDDGPDHAVRVEVRRDDFHVTRLKQRAKTTAIFAVDASGSAALHRLAEAKGAVELLLADCYVRRDRVAVLAFRGPGAELLLPPTSSLVRAKRSLAGLPGGGGTPLAAGIDAALALAGTVRRAGGTPLVAVLTDGRANIARGGAAGRPAAEADAMAAARNFRAAGIASLLVDTSPRPALQAERLAAEMGARYLPLPQADAASVSRAVRAASAGHA
jgi:magnesium chelatase subunit D